MRKTDKKVDNNLRQVLIEVCEIALEEFNGFQWLTHLVSYSNFPKSLNIICVFDTNENFQHFLDAGERAVLTALIEKKLSEGRIKINNIFDHVSFDTEENGVNSNNVKVGRY